MRNEIAKLLREAWESVGGLSEPSKMPCYSYSIPAWECKTGMKLRNVANTICSKCYALKGRYLYSNVKNALTKRFASIANKDWVEKMTFLIKNKESSGYFRWHDSGDLQSLEHLEKIVAVTRNLPSINFWLPTREYSIIAEYVAKHGSFPQNLTVRLSALLLEGKPPVSIAKRFNLVTSGVSKVGFTCPSSSQGGKCLTCRACWDKNVENVNYKQH